MSILAQTYRDIEVLLVDDGSTDTSGEICDALACQDARVRVIHQKNAGRMEARLAAVRCARGDFMTFVDSDDFIQEDMYRELMHLRETYDCDVVTSGMTSYFSDGDDVVSCDQVAEGCYNAGRIASEIIPAMFWKNESYGMIPSLCNKIFRKELLLQQYERSQGTRIAYGEDILIFYPLVTTLRSMFVTHKSYYFHRIKFRGNAYAHENGYLSEVYQLYAYLKRTFLSQNLWETVQKSVELMYIAAVDQRRRIYGQDVAGARYLFPFGSVRKQSRIVLYGAGTVGQAFYEQIQRTNYCEVVFWVDRQAAPYREKGLPVNDISALADYNYDVVVIAVKSSRSQEQIREMLVGTYGISDAKIVCAVSAGRKTPLSVGRN